MVARGALLTILIVSMARGLAAESPRPPAVPCEGPEARWPSNVLFLDGLDRHAHRMLQQSPTARRQCREIATATMLYVRVQLSAGLLDRPYRARSVVHKTVDGAMVAFVELGGRGQPAEWIAHEFEHVLEQLEGVCLDTLRRRGGGAWFSARDMFESTRAIQAGRRARHEVATYQP